MTDSIVFESAASVTMRRSRWLWQDHIFDHSLAVFAGPGGTGKSTYVLDFVARLTRGEVPGEHYGTPLTIGVWESEDPAAEITVPRLKAADADLDRIWLVKGTWRPVEDADEGIVTGIRMPEDEKPLRDFITAHSIDVMVVSPFANVIGGDLNKRENVAQVLARLSDIAEDLKVTFLLILHFNKGGGSVQDKISGSAAFRDHVRATFLFAHDEETGNRVITHDKGNYSATTGASFAFMLDSVEIPVSDGFAIVAQVRDLGASDVSVGEIINRNREGAEATEDRNEAKAFVLDYLKNSEAFEAPARDVLKAGHQAGFSDSDLQNARRRLKDPRVATRKSGYGAGWVWVLEADPSQPVSVEGVNEDAKGVSPRTVTSSTSSTSSGDTFGTPGGPQTRTAAPAEVENVTPIRQHETTLEGV